MADIGGPQIQDYGALGTSMLRGLADANATNTNAQLAQAQTQGAQLANKLKALQLSYLSQANAVAPDQQQVPSGSGQGAAPSTVGDTDVDPATIDQHTQANYAPTAAAPPPWLRQKAYLLSMAGMGDAGKLLLDNYAASMNALNLQKLQGASTAYSQMQTVAGAPDGTAVETLSRIDPAAADALRAKYKDDTPEQFDKDVRDYATAYGGSLFKYTGRELTVGTDGVARDNKTNKPVLGGVPAGLSTKDITDLSNKLDAPTDMPMSDGSTAKVPAWQAMGYRSKTAALYAEAGKTVAPPSPAPTPVAAPPAAPGAVPRIVSGAQPSALQPVQVSGQRASAPAQTPPDNGLLPGVNVAQLPKAAQPTVVPGRSQSPSAAIDANAVSTERVTQLKDAAQQQADDAKQRSLLQQAQNELASINPRTVGPGSGYYNDFLKAISAASGKAPDDYVDQVVLDKFLNQIGAGNVRQLLSGQRITNQEMMTFLTRGSPSTEQPLNGIKRIVSYMAADNDYDSRLQRTRIAALQTGADPYQLNGALETALPRASYIQQRTGMGMLSSARGGSQPSAASTATGPVKVQTRAQAMALAPGTVFVTPDGRQLVR
jgi:hypothetical protein